MKARDLSIVLKTMLAQSSYDDAKNMTEPTVATYAPVNTSRSFFIECAAYIVIGVLLIFANAPVFVNIIRHAALRAKKEYLLLAGTVTIYL